MTSFSKIEESIWPEIVKEAIIIEYGRAGDLESMIRLFVYLENDIAQSITPSAWSKLRSILQIQESSEYTSAAFKKLANEMIDATKRDSELDLAYTKIMKEMLGELGAAGAIIPRKEYIDAEKMNFEVVDSSDLITFGVQTLIRSIIPFNLLRQILSNRQAILSIDEFVNLVNKSTGSIVMVGLASLHVGVVVIKQLIDWWRGKITGIRCIKEIIDSTVTVTAGVIGGMAGGAVGSVAGPVGALVGGVIGGIWTADRAHAFSERMTRNLFGVPKDAALENAYKYFGVEMTASNEEINKAFRTFCLQHHPDKGGKSEDFIEVQLHMGVIKLARGDMNA